MNPGLEDIHKQVVDEWESKNKIGLSLDQQVLLLEKGIHAVEQRALKTLSNIFLTVILERVLYQSTEKFEFFSGATIDNGISFEALLKSNQDLDPKIIIEGLRYILIELLRVLGKLTAEILNKPLHAELQNVTFESKDNK